MSNPENPTSLQSVDLFDTIPDSAIPAINGEKLNPVGPNELLQELDAEITLESLISFGAVIDSEPDSCGCGECFTCMMEELGWWDFLGDGVDINSDPNYPDEEEFEDDLADYELGGEG